MLGMRPSRCHLDRERFGFSSSEAGAQGQTGGRKGKGHEPGGTIQEGAATAQDSAYRFFIDKAIARIAQACYRPELIMILDKTSPPGRPAGRKVVWTTHQAPPGGRPLAISYAAS